jgi:hypothetical protein
VQTDGGCPLYPKPHASIFLIQLLHRQPIPQEAPIVCRKFTIEIIRGERRLPLNRSLVLLGFLFITVMLLTVQSRVEALPEYSVQNAQSCLMCHTSSQGGGQRNLYGRQMISYLDLPANSPDYSELDNLTASIGSVFHLGFDFRSYYFSTPAETGLDDANSFVTMQGDLYFNFTPAPAVSVQIEHGLYGGFEAAAHFRIPGAAGPHLTVGRFIPSFGWKVDDHTRFTRRYTGFGGSTGGQGRDDGVELGMTSASWEVSTAVTNGGASPVDTDDGKALTARGAIRWAAGKFRFTTGASYRYEELGLTDAQLTRMGGIFWGTSVKNWIYLGEADIVVSNQTAFVHSHQILWRFKPGWQAKVGYDFHEPDRDVADGVDWTSRIAIRYIPYGYISVEPGAAINHEHGKESVSGDIMLHLWF